MFLNIIRKILKDCVLFKYRILIIRIINNKDIKKQNDQKQLKLVRLGAHAIVPFINKHHNQHQHPYLI